MDFKLVTYILLLVIALITSVCACLSFSSKNESSAFLLRGLSFVAIMALGLFSANFNDNISATVIYIMLGTAVYSLKIHDYKKFVNVEEKENKISDNENKKKIEFKLSLTSGISFAIATFCFFGAEIFLTKFNFFIIPLALIVTFGLVLPFIIFTKGYSIYDYILIGFMFLGSALMFGESILIIKDSFNIASIFFLLSSLMLIVSIFLSTYEDKKGIKCANLILQYLALIVLNAIIYLI